MQATQPVVQAAAPVLDQAAKAAAPVVQTVAPVVKTVAETAAPVVHAVATTATPVVQTASDALAPVVEGVAETVAPVVEDVTTPLASAARPVTTAVGTTLSRTTTRVTRTVATAPARVDDGTSLSQPPQPAGAETATISRDDPTQVSGASTQAGLGGFRSARTPLAGARIPSAAPDLAAATGGTRLPAGCALGRALDPGGRPGGVSYRNVTPASSAAPFLGRAPLGLALLGGLLAVGVAHVSTSSATGGGHSPSSTTAATTPRYRLVAPALRWRLRALADRVRPEPVVFPLELPG